MTRRLSLSLISLSTLWFFCALPSFPQATVLDTTPTDVTARAFSVVWAADEAVTSATLRVYADANGLTELTGGLGLRVESLELAETHAFGLAKVDVSGLAPNTCYYFQTETSTPSGTASSPASPPFTEVCTQVAAQRVNAVDVSIVNDLIRHNVYDADGGTPATGSLLVVSAPGFGTHPVSTVVGAGFASPTGVVDLNNLFDAATKLSAELAEGQVLQLVEFRGLRCSDLTEQRSVRFRRVPPHGEVPSVGSPITEIEQADLCFFADTFCDDTIDILDAQRVLSAFRSQLGDCGFNPDLDIVADQVINVLDVQSVLNRFGESAPFNP